MKKGNSFDDIIRDKLNQVTPAPQDGEWERFQELMEQENLRSSQEDAAFFDRVVRNKAPRYEESGLAKNWNSLLNRLDDIYRRERQILASKILELAALFLLLLVFDFNFRGDTAHFYVDAFHYPGLNTPAAVAPDGQQPAPTDARMYEDREGQTIPTTELPPPPADGMIPAPQTIETGFGRTFPDFSKVKTLEVLPPAGLYAPKIFAELQFPRFDVEAVEPITSLPKPLKTSDLNESIALRRSSRYSKPSRLSFSMFGSTDINRIYTPAYEAGPRSDFDRTTVSVPAFDRLQSGYSGGVGFSYGLMKRLELETGLLYTAKQYQARPVVYVVGSVQEGFFGEGLKDIEMNIAAIPVGMRYDLYRRSGWRVYAGAGASLQVVLESNYAVADQSAFRTSSFNPAPSAPDGPGVLKSTGLNAKNLEGGLLQGGAFGDNSFLTASGSLGLERRFSSGLSFFVQPTYHHSVFYFSKGLGPDYERLHTLSLFSGVRVRL